MLSKKVCLIGASAVGKTSLVKQFVEGIFSEKYLTTIGVKIDKKAVTVDNTEMQFLIWDIEGTDKFCGFTPRFLNGAQAYVVVLDQSRPSSMQDALEIFAKAQACSNAPAFLAINKSDLDNQLSDNQQQILNELNFVAISHTCAKNGESVEQLFSSIAAHLLKEFV